MSGNIPPEDAIFDANYPSYFRSISAVHWTPIKVIAESVKWLESKNAVHILDIGSGVGKFCLYGCVISDLLFTGVEIRKNLVEISNQVAHKLGLSQVNFLCQNITEIEFTPFNAAYFYNPFCEQEAISGQIDDSLTVGMDVLTAYETHVFQQLENAPVGFLFITYGSPHFQPPSCYAVQEILMQNELVFWKRVK